MEQLPIYFFFIVVSFVMITIGVSTLLWRNKKIYIDEKQYILRKNLTEVEWKDIEKNDFLNHRAVIALTDSGTYYKVSGHEILSECQESEMYVCFSWDIKPVESNKK